MNMIQMRFVILLYVSFGVAAVMPTLAAPYSEQTAFCQDQVRGRYVSQYEMQKAYNQCMSNANARIESYEREKSRREAEYNEWSREFNQDLQRRIREDQRAKKLKEAEIEAKKRDAQKLKANPLDFVSE